MANTPGGRLARPAASPSNEQWLSNARNLISDIQNIVETLPESFTRKRASNDLICDLLTVRSIERGEITCAFAVKSHVTNHFNGLHGGVVASIAEKVAEACVKSVAGDGEFFLGELGITYLLAARVNMEVEVRGSLLRQGRSVTVAEVEFKSKEKGQLLYKAQATFYSPGAVAAKL